jgi:carbon-monoxide dehydrogenase medium subunit
VDSDSGGGAEGGGALMLSSEFEFFAPTGLADALGLLGEHGGAKVLAGGMSMMPAMNLGILRPEVVVSFNHVGALDFVEEESGRLRIGSMVRHNRVATDPLIRRHIPILSEAAAVIGDVQIRHRGTLGGSVAHADPAADYLPVLVALDASIVVASAEGERTLAARDFFVDVMMTALGPGEAVVAIDVPKLAAGAGSAYKRFARVEGSFAIVNAAAIVEADGGSVIVIGGATATPVLVEARLDPSGSEEEALERAGEAAYAACEDAYGDLSGSPEYRRAMARVFARRALQQALAARG